MAPALSVAAKCLLLNQSGHALTYIKYSRCNIVRPMKRLIRRPDPLERDGVVPTLN